MPTIRCLLAAALLVLGAAWPSAASASPQQVVQQAVDGFIRPGYQRFHAAASALSEAVGRLCDAPSGERLAGARSAFADAVAAWSAIEIVRFGPVTEENRLERVLYWPDRKGLGLKQVQAALASQDATAADPATLAGKSVAMQGLGALEFVLFGTGADVLAATGDGFRCRYGAAIAANLDAIAAALQDEWQAPDGFAARWTAPGPENPLYRDRQEALTELLEVFVNGLELVRDQQLGGFLAEKAEDDRPKQALFWRSALTADALAANVAGLQALFDASRLADELSAETRWIGGSIDFEFANAADAAKGARGPIAEVLADPRRRSKLAYFGIVTSSLSEQFGGRLSTELGLTAGFSSLDGD